ncbi:MAG: FMN-binding protein [Clostridiaceae bacterium]|nr:FMN-binding protein [Clostridiaceae bacterium]
MKKVLMLLLAMVMIISLIGCSSPAATPDEEPAEVETSVEGTTNKYNDGTYTAVSDANTRGYNMATITIENDVIVNVELEEFQAMNNPKPEDYSYEAYHEAKDVLPERFVEANGTAVEVVTNATSSTTKWQQAVERALEKALVEPASTNEYFDGVFFGASEVGERGTKFARVTIENDTIIEVELTETTIPDGEENFKDEDYGFDTWHEAVEAMPARFVEANGTDVEIFTGATSSSTGWMEAVEDALENARR